MFRIVCVCVSNIKGGNMSHQSYCLVEDIFFNVANGFSSHRTGLRKMKSLRILNEWMPVGNSRCP